MTVKPQEKHTPPYLSYQTLQGYIGSLQQHGVPQRVDSSTMRQMSGQNQSMVRAALRYLKLINADDAPTDQLHQLIAADGADRQQRLRLILESAYPDLLCDESFSLASASDAQFREKFKSANLSAETARKAESFFLAAAKDAGIAISPHINQARKPGPASGTPRMRNGIRRGGRSAPGVATEAIRDRTPPPPTESRSTPATQPSPRQMVLEGLLSELPAKGWTKTDRDRWLRAFEGAVDWLVPMIEPTGSGEGS